MRDHTKLRPICTMAELAPAMGYSESTIRRMVIDGIIPKSCTTHIGKGSHVRLFTERLRDARILPAMPVAAGGRAVRR